MSAPNVRSCASGGPTATFSSAEALHLRLLDIPDSQPEGAPLPTLSVLQDQPGAGSKSTGLGATEAVATTVGVALLTVIKDDPETDPLVAVMPAGPVP